ncbi:hypothetical protein LguiB_020979 [Lonicera macranthoides]
MFRAPQTYGQEFRPMTSRISELRATTSSQVERIRMKRLGFESTKLLFLHIVQIFSLGSRLTRLSLLFLPNYPLISRLTGLVQKAIEDQIGLDSIDRAGLGRSIRFELHNGPYFLVENYSRKKLGVFYGENTREMKRKLVKTFSSNRSLQIEKNRIKEKDERLHFTRLDRFIRGSGEETNGLRGNANPLYSFILSSSNIGRIGRENENFTEADDALKLHDIVHCSLDIVAERGRRVNWGLGASS